jgi:hypothetical protein
MLKSYTVCLSICGSTALCWTSAAFQFFNLFTQSVGLLGRGIKLSQGRYLHTGQHKQNKGTLTSMPRKGFEPTIPVFERAKTVHDLDRAATVIGKELHYVSQYFRFRKENKKL